MSESAWSKSSLTLAKKTREPAHLFILTDPNGRRRVEEIAQSLVVDLHVRHSEQELALGVLSTRGFVSEC